jgi:hypothetical protein
VNEAVAEDFYTSMTAWASAACSFHGNLAAFNLVFLINLLRRFQLLQRSNQVLISM